MGALTHLVEIAVWDPVVGASKTLRLSTSPYDHPSAPGPYDDRLVSKDGLGSISRALFQSGLSGSTRLDWGTVTVANPDGALNWLFAHDCALDGGLARRLVGVSDQPYSSFAPYAVGIIERAARTPTVIQFRWRDAAAAVRDLAFQSATYAGDDNAAGVEGAAAIAGQLKPAGLGQADNVTPTQVTNGLLVFQASDRAGLLRAVRVGGVSIPAGVQRASLALLLATAPAAGTYDWCSVPAGIYFRMGSSPDKDPTCDITIGGTAADRTAAQLWRQALVERGGVLSSAIATADVAALDATIAAEVEYWANASTTVGDVLDYLAGSVGAASWLSPTSGLWRIRRLVTPDDLTPVATLRASSLTNPLQAGDIPILRGWTWIEDTSDQQGLPAAALALSYSVNHTVQGDGDLKGDKTSPSDPVGGLSRRQWLALDSRVARWSDSTVAAHHQLARTLTFKSGLRDRAAAEAEVARRGAIYGKTPQWLQVPVAWTPTAAALDLADGVIVDLPEAGVVARPYAIAGLRVDPDLGTGTVTLWRPGP